MSLVGRPNYVFDRSFHFQGEQSKVLHMCILHGSKGQVLTKFVAKHVSCLGHTIRVDEMGDQ